MLLLLLSQRLVYKRGYLETVEHCSYEYGVPSSIIYAVIFTESGFDKNALSHAGAMGLMQLMPQTFASISSELNILSDDPYHPEVNIRCGTRLLAKLYDKYGSWDTAFAAYNAGEKAVDGWLSDRRYSEGGKLVNIPYKETSEYVKKVNNAVSVYTRLYDR